jgi:hypothetical protein
MEIKQSGSHSINVSPNFIFLDICFREKYLTKIAEDKAVTPSRIIIPNWVNVFDSIPMRFIDML